MLKYFAGMKLFHYFSENIFRRQHAFLAVAAINSHKAGGTFKAQIHISYLVLKIEILFMYVALSIQV